MLYMIILTKCTLNAQSIKQFCFVKTQFKESPLNLFMTTVSLLGGQQKPRFCFDTIQYYEQIKPELNSTFKRNHFNKITM